MSNMEINSREYWEGRFRDNWDDVGGPSQTAFFAELGVRLFPDWLRRDLCNHAWHLADIGCAEGEGAELLRSQFPNLKVEGLDFSAHAIETAKSRHPEVGFREADLTSLDETFDVVFCSNVLEHFPAPAPLLDRLADCAKEYLILMVPGWEYARHAEHHVTFTLTDLPSASGGLSLAHLAAVNCAEVDRHQWPGFQLLAVYARPEALRRVGVTGADLVQSAALPGLTRGDLDLLLPGEPALAFHLKRAGSGSTGTWELKELKRLVTEMAQRQEAIGYNSRNELGGDINRAREEIAGVKDALLSFASLSDRLAHGLAAETAKAVEAQERSRRVEQEGLEAQERIAGLLTGIEEKDLELARWRAAVELQEREKEELDELIEKQKLQREHLGECINQLEEENLALREALAALEQDRERFIQCATQYEQQLRDIHASSSWRLTGALRWLRAKATGVGGAAPIPAPPFPLRVEARPRVQEGSGELAPVTGDAMPARADSAALNDLDWQQFQAEVLARRKEFKGIFIQELVIDWNVPLYQRPQHMAAAMARLGYLVVYRTDNWGGDDVNGFREVLPNIWLTNCAETDTIENAVRSAYSTAYAHSVSGLSERPAGSVMVYEYIDHIDPKISGEPEAVRKLEEIRDWAFGGNVSLVVASAKVLYDEAVRAVGPERTLLVQNGVDTRHYRDPVQLRVPVPEVLHAFRDRFTSIVGYFGAIAPWLWYEAIQELVRGRPDIGFVFIGPDYYSGVERLPREDNVLYLGTVDYKVLPGYARHFDVCFIPFEPGEIAKTTSPLKLFEYFALEKPVVVTSDMAECVAHPEVFHGGSVDELSAAIDRALAVKDDPATKRRLRELADLNDWDRRAEVFAQAFEHLESPQGS